MSPPLRNNTMEEEDYFEANCPHILFNQLGFNSTLPNIFSPLGDLLHCSLTSQKAVQFFNSEQFVQNTVTKDKKQKKNTIGNFLLSFRLSLHFPLVIQDTMIHLVTNSALGYAILLILNLWIHPFRRCFRREMGNELSYSNLQLQSYSSTTIE
jgi:hypothetical protein